MSNFLKASSQFRQLDLYKNVLQKNLSSLLKKSLPNLQVSKSLQIITDDKTFKPSRARIDFHRYYIIKYTKCKYILNKNHIKQWYGLWKNSKSLNLFLKLHGCDNNNVSMHSVHLRQSKPTNPGGAWLKTHHDLHSETINEGCFYKSPNVQGVGSFDPNEKEMINKFF